MIEMDRADYKKIEKFIERSTLSPEPLSVVLGNNPGRVFVDQVEQPETALIWSQGIEGFYLIGNEKNASCLSRFDAFIDQTITPMLKSMGYDYLEVSPSHESWHDVMESIFRSRGLDTWRQCTYALKEKPDRIEAPEKLPYITRNIKDLFDVDTLNNSQYLYDTLLLYWESIDDLKARGSCFYAEKDNTVIGICFTGFVTKNEKVLNIETDDRFRRMGIAYNLAVNCISEILEDEKTAYWDCMEENVGSQRLAEKLGFTRTGTYTCYGFPLMNEPV